MALVYLEHWWISQSEQLALDTLKASLETFGITLTDDPDEADRAGVRAMLMTGQGIWDSLTEPSGFRPLPLSPYVDIYDIQHRLFPHFRAIDSPSRLALLGIPIGVSRCNVVWLNRRVAETIGGRPDGMREFIRWLAEAGKIAPHPLAVSPEDWSIGLLFESIVLSLADPDFHRSVFGMGSAAALESGEMRDCLEALASLKPLVAPQASVNAWHEAAATCRQGACAATVIGDWAHHEFARPAGSPPCEYEAVCKWEFPGTERTFLYNVDYVVPVDSGGRATDEDVLARLVTALLSPELQSRFGQVKGAHPPVRDAVESNIDPHARKLFHLATLSPNLFVPSMGLRQCSPTRVRHAITDAVRDLLFGAGDVFRAHEAVKAAWRENSAASGRRPLEMARRSVADEQHRGQVRAASVARRR